jgi:hypothetical protein
MKLLLSGLDGKIEMKFWKIWWWRQKNYDFLWCEKRSRGLKKET